MRNCEERHGFSKVNNIIDLMLSVIDKIIKHKILEIQDFSTYSE